MATQIPEDQFAKLSEQELYERLGKVQRDNMTTAFHALALHAAANDLATQSNGDLGRSFFQRLNKQAYDFFCGGCGGAKDQSCLDHLKAALDVHLGRDAIIASVAGLLVAALGLHPIVAGIAAAILVGFVFPTALDDLCHAWGKTIAA